jgi:hypothetical protein
MLQIGKSVRQKDDVLKDITVEELFSCIKKPTEEVSAIIRRARHVRTLDKEKYNEAKRQLPYVVCGIFHPSYRRTENFGHIEYFMVDIDHIQEKGLSLDAVKQQMKNDPRVVLCFVSPGQDGLKVLFRLTEKCYDTGKYSLFYKAFVRLLSQQYHLEQVVDGKTSDVTRACFLSEDAEACFNPEAEPVDMKRIVDFDNPLETQELKNLIDKEEKEEKASGVAEETPKSEPDETAIAFIRQRLNPKALKHKPQVYVPAELEQVVDELVKYVTESGVEVAEVTDIQYGKKFKFSLGMKQAEINLFFGKHGFSVVRSPRTGTLPEFNDLMAEYIEAFIDGLYD